MRANARLRELMLGLLAAAACATASVASAQDPAPNAAKAEEPASPEAPTSPSSTPSSPPSQATSGTGSSTDGPVTTIEKKWYDVVNMGAFVDGYYSQNWKSPTPSAGANRYHPYTANTGFNLSWVGLDMSVDPDPVGATLQLRFGPAVPFLSLGDSAIPGGIGFVQNGFVSWKPSGKDGRLTLYLGKFDTVYGAEVAQSHLNINYTRGYLYNLAQPFFHTGARADIALSDLVTVKLLAVNGWNNTIDNNRGKSFGAQVTLTPLESLSFSAGYMGGPEGDEVLPATGSATASTRNVGVDSRWRHLADAVVDFKPTSDLRFVANADYVTQAMPNATGPKDASASWYGAAILARYSFSRVFAAGLRGEYVRDDDGLLTVIDPTAPPLPLTLYTGTLTLEAAPHKLLLIRLDNRLDVANESVFATLHGTDKTQWTTTLGVVAKTN